MQIKPADFSSLQHGQTWNEMWGRPGAGAPNSKEPTFKKPKFNDVLHHPEARNGLVSSFI